MEYDWRYFKRNKTKEIFIDEFVRQIINYYKLNTKEIEQLKYIINYGIALECFKSHNIEFTGGKIKNIKGLIFDNNTRLFSISEQNHPKKATTTKTTKKSNIIPLFIGKYVSITEKWNKFMAYFDAKSNSTKEDFNDKFEKSNSVLHSKVEKSDDS